MSETVSHYNTYIKYGEEYLCNTIKNLSERVKLLEERLAQPILKFSEETADGLFRAYDKDLNNSYNGSKDNYSTIYGTHTFLDCTEQDSKRTIDFYNK